MTRIRTASRLTSTGATAILVGLTACSSGENAATYTKIDDMEGASGHIAWTPPAGTPGGWSSFADTQCDRLLPVPSYAGGTWSYEAVPTPYQTLPGVTSRNAARIRTTSPLVNQYGAGISVDFDEVSAPIVAPGACPYPAPPLPSALAVDLTAYRGVSFWGMATPGAGTATVSVRIDDDNTDPRGGICDPASNATVKRGCFNSFRASVDLTSTFTRYTVDFSQLRQGDYGYRAEPSALDLLKIYALSFQVDTPGGSCFFPAICAGAPPTLTFDIWIDDLYFVNK